jgi:hypothetical protein
VGVWQWLRDGLFAITGADDLVTGFGESPFGGDS